MRKLAYHYIIDINGIKNDYSLHLPNKVTLKKILEMICEQEGISEEEYLINDSRDNETIPTNWSIDDLEKNKPSKNEINFSFELKAK